MKKGIADNYIRSLRFSNVYLGIYLDTDNSQTVPLNIPHNKAVAHQTYLHNYYL